MGAGTPVHLCILACQLGCLYTLTCGDESMRAALPSGSTQLTATVTAAMSYISAVGV